MRGVSRDRAGVLVPHDIPQCDGRTEHGQLPGTRAGASARVDLLIVTGKLDHDVEVCRVALEELTTCGGELELPVAVRPEEADQFLRRWGDVQMGRHLDVTVRKEPLDLGSSQGPLESQPRTYAIRQVVLPPLGVREAIVGVVLDAEVRGLCVRAEVLGSSVGGLEEGHVEQ
eukprot:16312539-Heterocapsa_arctica.AAC.2